MINPEMQPYSPENNEMKQKEKGIPPAVEVRHNVESAEESDASQQKATVEALSRGMTEEEVIRLAQQHVAESYRENEARDQRVVEQMDADQSKRIRGEVLQNRETITGNGAPLGDDSQFFQNEMTSGRPGMSEWIVEHIPGGKKLVVLLALIGVLSVNPKDAEAGDKKDSFFEILKKEAVKDATNQAKRGIRYGVETPGRMLNQAQQAEQVRRRQEQQKSQQLLRQQEQESQRYKKAQEQYKSQVAKTINAFNQSFNNILFQKFPSYNDRDRVLLKVASDTINLLVQSDNAYLGQYGGEAYDLSTVAKEKLHSFVEGLETHRYSDVEYPKNPLDGVTVENITSDRR